MPIDLANATKWQHFIPETEQSLNARNPHASKRNQKIFSFSVDHQKGSTVLDDPEGRSIKSSLAVLDLFSFDVQSHSSLRKNLERLFIRYEANTRENTKSLLLKLESSRTPNLKDEVLNLFASKFLNFLRNPFSVKKVLGALAPILRYQPTDAALLAEYQAVVDGARPQQKHLCSTLGLSSQEYTGWLLGLFMLLDVPGGEGINLLEGIVKSLYEDTSNETLVCVYCYSDEDSDKRCLLSDRGYCNPLPTSQHLAFSFNLCSHAFIHYVFARTDQLGLARGYDRNLVEAHKRRHPKTVNVRSFNNDLDALSRYNQNVILQCYRNVYSSSPTIYGV